MRLKWLLILNVVMMMSKDMCSSRELMNDKSFYTLIRRFRHQYKKYHALKDVLDEYYDENLVKACKNADDELMDTTNRIVLMVLGGFINPDNTEVEFSQDVSEPFFGFGNRMARCVPLPSHQHFKVTVDDKELYEFVLELFEHYWND